MIARLPIFLGFISALVFNSCSKTPDLTEDEVYTILNEIITDDSLRMHNLCIQFEELDLTPEYAQEFTKQDCEFITRQKSIFLHLAIKPKKLKYYNWKSRKAGISPFIDINRTCDSGFVDHISFPMISIDRKKVLLGISEDCHCLLGSQGGKYLFIKENGRWVRMKSFDSWISSLERQYDENNRRQALNGNL